MFAAVRQNILLATLFNSPRKANTETAMSDYGDNDDGGYDDRCYNDLSYDPSYDQGYSYDDHAGYQESYAQPTYDDDHFCVQTYSHDFSRADSDDGDGYAPTSHYDDKKEEEQDDEEASEDGRPYTKEEQFERGRSVAYNESYHLHYDMVYADKNMGEDLLPDPEDCSPEFRLGMAEGWSQGVRDGVNMGLYDKAHDKYDSEEEEEATAEKVYDYLTLHLDRSDEDAKATIERRGLNDGDEDEGDTYY